MPELSEPDFLSQTAEPMTSERRREWYRARAREAESQGAVWHRFSYHPEQTDILLYEGWKVRPDDEGEPRFQFAAKESQSCQK